MKRIYLVCYDIADPVRWRHVFRTMKGYGESVQLSVFRCALTPEAYATMAAELSEQVHHGEDKILIADLGPANGRERLAFIGRSVPAMRDGPIIL